MINHTVSVIRAGTFSECMMCGWNGTEEERTLYREYFTKPDERDDANQKKILKLSTFGRMRTTASSGQNVQMCEPELVAEEIRWMRDQVV